MSKHFRFIPVLVAASFALSSCSTVNKALDASMGVFKPREAAADALGEDGLPVPGRVSTADFNTALMIVEINGLKRKVVIELHPEIAPKTVANFKKLVNEGYYNGMAFHRAIRNYVVQTGDPATKGDSNRDAWGLTDVGYKLPAELGGKHARGAIAMARPGDLDSLDKQSSGSQFFVCLRTQKRLDGNYTVFANVVQGLEILESIGSSPVDTNDAPVRRFEVKSISLVSPNSEELKPEAAARPKTKPDSEKGGIEKFIERIW